MDAAPKDSMAYPWEATLEPRLAPLVLASVSETKQYADYLERSDNG